MPINMVYTFFYIYLLFSFIMFDDYFLFENEAHLAQCHVTNILEGKGWSKYLLKKIQECIRIEVHIQRL